MHRPFKSRQPRGQRGVVIIWLAMFLLALVGLIALGVDIAKLMAARTQLQNAADAGALAGASSMLSTGFSSDSALVRAKLTASMNKAYTDMPTPVTISDADVVINVPRRTVQVTTSRDPGAGNGVITYFAKVLGITSLQMSAVAMAKADPASKVCYAIVPMAAIADTTNPWVIGQSYLLVLDSPTSGNFGMLDFSSLPTGSCGDSPCDHVNGGAATVSCQAENGLNCCISKGQWVDTKTGLNSGPLESGLDARWDADTDRTSIEYQDYLHNGNGNGKRVVFTPLVTEWQPNGKKAVFVRGFAAFFLQVRPTNARVQAEYVDIITSGTADSTAMGTAYVVHLIQ